MERIPQVIHKLVTLLVVCCVLSAWAPPVAAERGVDGRIQAGERYFGQRRFDAALRAFDEAYEATSRVALLYNIAMCQWELDRVPDAVNTFRRYLDADRANLSVSDRREIEQIIVGLRSRHGDVVLVVEERGASVLVDEQEVGLSPLTRPVAVSAGQHTFGARLGDRSGPVVTRSVGAGETVTVALALEAEGVSDDPEPDENGDGDDPSVTADAGPLPWWFWTSTALAGASVLGVAITGGLTLSYRSDYQESGQLDLDAYDRGTALGVATDVLIGVASVAATAAVVSLIIHLVQRRR